MKRQLNTGKTLLTVLAALVILVVSQMLSLFLGNLLVRFGCPIAFGNAAAGVLYPLIVYSAVLGWIKVFLKQDVERYRIKRFRLKPVWCIAAVLMPCIVSLILLSTPGHFVIAPKTVQATAEIICGGVFFYGFGAGITEELVFRVLILNALEYRWNKSVAIFIPSILFGALHVIGSNLSLGSIIQLLFAGSVVGILFSLVTYESGSVWNSALIHSIWNIVMIGGILQIGTSPQDSVIWNYILDSKSVLLTGGDFGIEASFVAIAVYCAAIMLAAGMIVKKQQKRSL